MKIAITGHTSGLGKSFYDECIARGHIVQGFSRSNGYDLRDYSQVGIMLEQGKDFELFINNAKADYIQAQILYRLARKWTHGTIVSIGSGILETDPAWTDTFLLEYFTQKIALQHAHHVLEPLVAVKLILLNPGHLGDNTRQYAKEQLDQLGI